MKTKRTKAPKPKATRTARAPKATPAPALALNCDAIDSQPQDIDWRESMGENCDGWRAFEALECPECHRTLVATDVGQIRCCDLVTDVAEDVDGEEIMVPNLCKGEIYPDGPMMCSWYPVKIDDCTESALKIASLPLCVIEFSDGRTGLALTGGGMDLSWEICEAFIALGYFPPLAFCDLPAMAGRGKSDRDRNTIAACQESCRIAASWATRKIERLADLAKRCAS